MFAVFGQTVTYECFWVLEKRVDDPATGVAGSTDDGDVEHGDVGM
jgi:hypothetical protein